MKIDYENFQSKLQLNSKLQCMYYVLVTFLYKSVYTKQI